jgi:hypothetical protein
MMSRPWLIAPAVLLALAAGAAAFRLGFPPPADEQRLQGTWWIERADPAFEQDGADHYARIDDSIIRFYKQEAGSHRAIETTRSPYRLAHEEGRRRIELTSEIRIAQTFTEKTEVDPAEKPPEDVVSIRQLGVYDLRGDTLTLFYGPAQGFPERIEDPPPRGAALLVMRSVPPRTAPWYVRSRWTLWIILLAAAIVSVPVANRWAGRPDAAEGRRGWWALFWATMLGLFLLGQAWLETASIRAGFTLLGPEWKVRVWVLAVGGVASLVAAAGLAVGRGVGWLAAVALLVVLAFTVYETWVLYGWGWRLGLMAAGAALAGVPLTPVFLRASVRGGEAPASA